MKKEESVNEYFAGTLTIANKMRSHGKKVSEKKVVEKILRSMTTKFNYVVCSIEEGNNVEQMLIDTLQSSLLVQEARMQGQKEEEQTLKVSYSSRGRERGRGAGRGRGRQTSKEHIECYKCQKLGHYQNECPNLEGNVENYAGFDDEEEMLLIAIGNDQETIREWIWFLNSGCSTHMCGRKEWFVDLEEDFRETVKVGDGRKLSVEGRRSVKLKIDGKVRVISNVHYVPNLRSNLLSIGQLQ